MDLARYIAQRPADVFNLRLTDIRHGELHIRQRKSGKAIRIIVEAKLKQVIDRIRARKYQATSTALVRNEQGEELTLSAFDNRFKGARRRAGVDLRSFQFRDLRAKGGTDKADREGYREAQKLLGHTSIKTTESYIRRRVGERVKPVR